MPTSAEAFCQRAIAYLKVQAPASDVIELTLSPADSPILQPFAQDLLVAYLVDEGESFAYVQQRHLDQAGISPQALHLIGLRNLAALAEERADVRAHGELFAVLLDGHFEASLLLLDEFWSQWYAQLLPNAQCCRHCPKPAWANRSRSLAIAGPGCCWSCCRNLKSRACWR